VKTTRLEAFSDGVIAIIMTIMVLDLHVPKEWNQAEIQKIVPTLLCYALSFLIVAIYWINHHHLIHLVKKVNALTLWANINLLFWMSLIPWATACLGKYHQTPAVVALYGSIATLCSLSFHLLRRAIAFHHSDDENLKNLHWRQTRKNYFALLIYLASIPIAWVNEWASMSLIALPALLYFLPDRRAERLPKSD